MNVMERINLQSWNYGISKLEEEKVFLSDIIEELTLLTIWSYNSLYLCETKKKFVVKKEIKSHWIVFWDWL